MINVNKLILDTLKPLNIQVAKLKYTGDLTTYIVFQEYLQQAEIFADDEESVIGCYFQFNIFSKGDYTDLVKNVKEKLKNVGFRRTSEAEIYENDTGYYNKIIKFYFESEEN